MNWGLSIIAAVLSGITGLLSAGFIANACVSWYHVSSREGNSGYFVIFLALLGGVAGFVIGLIAARMVAADPATGFLKMAGCGLGSVLAVAGIAVLLCYLLADIPPKLNGQELQLEVEIKLPAGHAKPEGAGDVELGSVVNGVRRKMTRGVMQVLNAREESGRWIVPAQMEVFTARGQRSVMASLGEEQIAAFLVPLPAYPTEANESWSDWLPHPREGSPPWPESKASYRFRIQRIQSNP